MSVARKQPLWSVVRAPVAYFLAGGDDGPVRANTKSEARARLKRAAGLDRLPPGVVLTRLKEQV